MDSHIGNGGVRISEAPLYFKFENEYSEVSLIWTPLNRTNVWEAIMIIYRDSALFIRIFIYPDSQRGIRGICTSEGSL